MDFLPDKDQDALVDSSRDFVESRFPLNRAPEDAVIAPGDTRWKEITDLGWLGLATTEDCGGSGASLLEEAFVFREIGRGLVPGPILSTLAGARLAAWTGHRELAQRALSGEMRISRAIPVPGDSDTEALLINHPEGAEVTLMTAHGTAALYVMPPDLLLHNSIEDGEIVGRTTSRSLGDPILSADGADAAALGRVLTTLASAQLSGIAVATKDMAVSYAKSRVQFGKPIGGFQVIKHRCADMAISAHAAENVMFMAALTESYSSTGTDFDSLAAAAFCRRAAFTNAQSNIQIHGAMGFTVESAAHRFVKRAHVLSSTEELGRASYRLSTLPRQ